MTKHERGFYVYSVSDLIRILDQAAGMKIRLDCGHHLTIMPGHALVNDFTVRQCTRTVVCAMCGYEGH